MKLQIEYHRMEIISGVLRPMRSAIQPAAVAPTSRSHKVNVKTMVTAVIRNIELLGDRHHDQAGRW